MLLFCHIMSCSKRVFFGCLNRVVDGYDVVKKRGPTADGQPGRSIAGSSEESHGTCRHKEANQI